MLWLAEGIQICEYAVALKMTWVFSSDMGRVSVHAHYLFLYILFCICKINTVTKRLAHLLLAVYARKSAACLILWQKHLWLNQHLIINRVELSHNLPCLLNHWKLVFSNRNCCCLEGCDICRLTDRICKKSHRYACLKVSHLYLALYCRITL